MSPDELAEILTTLKNTLKVQAAMLATTEQRETRLHDAIRQEIHLLHNEVVQMHQRVNGIIGSASAQIAQSATQAMAPVTAQYQNAVTSASNELRGNGRMIWSWYGAMAGLLLLLLAVGWAVLGYYRRELNYAQSELARYENAIPVVQAFYASDAALCGGRLCVNVDPNGRRVGNKRQYRPAMPRTQP